MIGGRSLNQPVADVLGITSKIAKDVKSMFKEVKESASVMGLITEGFQQFSILSIVMEAFQPIIEIIGGLFKIMAAQILPVLMKALRPLMDILISLIPVFIIIGKVIGILMQVALIPLMIGFEILEAILTPLLPLLEPFIDILDDLSPIITALTKILKDGLLFVIKLVWAGIAWIVNGIIDIMNWIGRTFNAFSHKDIAHVATPSFDDGGRMLKRGMVQMEANEIAVTGNQMGGLEDRLDILIEQNKKAEILSMW